MEKTCEVYGCDTVLPYAGNGRPRSRCEEHESTCIHKDCKRTAPRPECQYHRAARLRFEAGEPASESAQVTWALMVLRKHGSVQFVSNEEIWGQK